MTVITLPSVRFLGATVDCTVLVSAPRKPYPPALIDLIKLKILEI